MSQYTATPTRRNTLEFEFTSGTWTQMHGLTNISVSFGNEMEQYYTYDSVWQDTDILGKSMTVSVEGKRYKDDTAQNNIAAMFDKDGDDATVPARITSPSNGKVIENLFAVEVGELFGGDPNSNDNIVFTLHSKGEPTVTAIQAGNGQ